MEHRLFYMKSKKVKDCLKYACISNIDKMLIFQGILLGTVQDIKTAKLICTPIPPDVGVSYQSVDFIG